MRIFSAPDTSQIRSAWPVRCFAPGRDNAIRFHAELLNQKKAAHGDMSRLGGRGILIFKKHSTGEAKYIMPPCGMSSIFLVFFGKKKKSYERIVRITCKQP